MRVNPLRLLLVSYGLTVAGLAVALAAGAAGFASVVAAWLAAPAVVIALGVIGRPGGYLRGGAEPAPPPDVSEDFAGWTRDRVDDVARDARRDARRADAARRGARP